MKFEDIECIIGHDAITQIESTIASILRASEGDHNTVCALRELLVGMLAAIVTTKTYLPVSEQLAAEDAAKLNALVGKIKEITPPQPSAQAPSAVAVDVRGLPREGAEQPSPQLFVPSVSGRSVVQLLPVRARAKAAAMESHQVIPFRVPARQPQPSAEAASTTNRESMCHATCLDAARTAIARRKELIAQKREVFARSLALLAKSQSLRTSLEAVQLGRHY